jgi:hypothetical protein
LNDWPVGAPRKVVCLVEDKDKEKRSSWMEVARGVKVKRMRVERRETTLFSLLKGRIKL